jgi:urocanate hydratase
MTRLDPTRVIRAPIDTQLSARSWLTEAPLRMLMNKGRRKVRTGGLNSLRHRTPSRLYK